MNTDTQIRAFIAIDIPEELKIKLQLLQDDLKRANPTGIKWVETRNIHLTLKFLSSISTSTVDSITGVLRTVCASHTPFSLQSDKPGAFPNPRQPRVFWLGLNGNLTALTALQKAIEDQLAPLGFAPETRPFTAHLTLARVRDGITPSAQRSFGESITKTGWQDGESWTVGKVLLMQSRLFPAGPVYNRLAEIPLAAPE
jgi:2'-5' RNA ligase